METKLNVAEILKNKPEGTKLWTDVFGSVTLYVVTDACDAFQVKHHNKEPWFDKEGKLYREGVLCIYPSNSMRDWSKFAWKKGDLLTNSCGFQCIFKEWASDDYTRFNGCYSNSRDGYEDVPNAETDKFYKLDNNTAYGYVREIEKRFGGIFNLETLEIEKTQPEFKDWDFITIKLSKGGSLIGVFKAEDDKKYYLHANLDSRGIITISEDSYCKKSTCIARLSTEEEKQQFFDALAKKGKAWDADKKQIVDLKTKVELKPFDKVLVREEEYSEWQADFFSNIDEDNRFVCIGSTWSFCIPYNEETAKLIGTTNNAK